MKFAILYAVKDAPFGGANQFLKALDKQFDRLGCRASGLETAEVVLFNSHHEPKRVLEARRDMPGALFIHRVDGPMRLYNDAKDGRDDLVARLNSLAADATIFQSEWSREQNRRLGWSSTGPEAVIGNAPDPALFHPPETPRKPGHPVRLIAASWSAHPRKGFDVYSHLDRHLDFSRFQMTFLGNSPIEFERIRRLPPAPSAELADHFKASDIFVTGSQADPCSNSLIEALHCGLPAIARKDGGHPEILGRGGLLFETAPEVPALLERILSDYQRFVAEISLPSLLGIAGRYVDFAASLLEMRDAGKLKPKHPGLFARWRMSRLLSAKT